VAAGELTTPRRFIDAAAATLKESGVASISTRRIASRAGINQAWSTTGQPTTILGDSLRV
jgi:DNA-binding transcriptional regulator YbjK